MYTIIRKPNVKAKSVPSRQQSLPSDNTEIEETEHTEEEVAKFEGLPVCPVSGDSKACNKMACLRREKVKHPYYLIHKPKPAPDDTLTTEPPGRSRSDMMYDKSTKSEKPVPRPPPPKFPLPPTRDPLQDQQECIEERQRCLEEQQRRVRLTEY